MAALFELLNFINYSTNCYISYSDSSLLTLTFLEMGHSDFHVCTLLHVVFLETKMHVNFVKLPVNFIAFKDQAFISSINRQGCRTRTVYIIKRRLNPTILHFLITHEMMHILLRIISIRMR